MEKSVRRLRSAEGVHRAAFGGPAAAGVLCSLARIRLARCHAGRAPRLRSAEGVHGHAGRAPRLRSTDGVLPRPFGGAQESWSSLMVTDRLGPMSVIQSRTAAPERPWRSNEAFPPRPL